MTLENSGLLLDHVPFEQLFEKRTVAELTEDQMMTVDGGTGIPCGIAIGVTLTLIYIMLK